jgi:Fe-S cluster biogenesis protein NfuA
MDKENMEEKVLLAIEQLRPFLHADGGDVSFVGITNDGVVQVKFSGSCLDCSMSEMTLKAGIEEAVKKMAPDIKSVEAVN